MEQTLIKNFYSKINGNTFINVKDNGYDGQEKLKLLKTGDEIVPVREPNNPFDKFAIRLDNTDGFKLGYIPSKTSNGLAQDMDNGLTVIIKVSEVTGGNDSKSNVGCNIHISVYGESEPMTTNEILND